jgi:hypothetical protein
MLGLSMARAGLIAMATFIPILATILSFVSSVTFVIALRRTVL